MGLGGLGMWEMIMIFLVVLLLFGAKRLPEIGSSLGKGIREFKGSIREIEKEVKAVDDEPARGAVPSPSDASDEPDEGPRRLTTTQGPVPGVGHAGGVPTQEAPHQGGARGEESVPEGSEPEGSEEKGSKEEAPTG
jgi:sec-independent protein translocase protein TatA